MESRNKVMRDGKLIVVKHSGTASVEEFVENDAKLFSLVDPEGGGVQGLADISELLMDQVGFGEISQVFDSLARFSKEMTGTNMAIFLGDRGKEELLKTSVYSKHESRLDMDIRIFVHLKEAMDWLTLSAQEREEIEGFFAQ